MTKSKKQEATKKSPAKRCQVRAWEIVYKITDQTPEILMKFLRSSKWGIYEGFGVTHLETDNHHVHLGIILRDKINVDWKHIAPYFLYPGLPPPLTTPLKNKSRKFDVKLQQYYDYAMDQLKHVDQEIGTPYFYKWTPKEKTEDGLDLEKCSIETYVLHFYKTGLTLHQIEELMGTRRQSQFFTKLSALKKMIYNYECFHNDETVTHELTSYKPEVIELIKEKWDPKKQTLLLKGPSNRGKTEFGKSLLKDITQKNALVISNLNRLTCAEKGQGLLFDDMNFKQVSRSKAIQLTDVENDRDIRILFGIHTITAGTPKIMTTNEDLDDFFPWTQSNFFGNQLDEAIKRRICYIDLTKFGKLYT